MKKPAQFKSPQKARTGKGIPHTNLDWAQFVKERDARTGYPHSKLRDSRTN